ncbi:MAG: TspO/MBR family protein [Hyphomicrobiales bacterium]|nr:TspO/MBR family protein [Hyphomicrobiales bacterium]
MSFSLSDAATFGVFLGAVAAAALFAGQWAGNDWYRNLDKPSFTPPDWAFPVAWSILYLMIATAGWFVWMAPESGNRTAALNFWYGQIFINAVWSYIFFGRKQLDVALVTLTMMWALIIGFIMSALLIDQRAALLFIPYLIWVTYAGLLNAVILLMNPNPQYS